MTTTLAFALRPALPADVDFEHRLYASTRNDLRPFGPEVFDGLVGMQFRAQSMSIRLDHPSADRQPEASINTRPSSTPIDVEIFWPSIPLTLARTKRAATWRAMISHSAG